MIKRAIPAVVVVMFVFLGTTVQRGSAAQSQGAGAQPAAPPRRLTVQVIQVKPEMLNNYIAAVRDEVVPAEKKAGLPWRVTFRPVFGNLQTFVTVRPLANYAAFDQPNLLQRALGQPGADALLTKLRSMIVSTRLEVETLLPDLSIESGMGSPDVVQVAEVTLVGGRGGEWNTLMREQFLPALKKAGVKDFWVHGVNFGGEQRRVIVQPIANLAELDSGAGATRLARGAGGPEAAQKLIQERGALQQRVELNVLRRVPELSYSPPAKPMAK